MCAKLFIAFVFTNNYSMMMILTKTYKTLIIE